MFTGNLSSQSAVTRRSPDNRTLRLSYPTVPKQRLSIADEFSIEDVRRAAGIQFGELLSNDHADEPVKVKHHGEAALPRHQWCVFTRCQRSRRTSKPTGCFITECCCPSPPPIPASPVPKQNESSTKRVDQISRGCSARYASRLRQLRSLLRRRSLRACASWLRSLHLLRRTGDSGWGTQGQAEADANRAFRRI